MVGDGAGEAAEFRWCRAKSLLEWNFRVPRVTLTGIIHTSISFIICHTYLYDVMM